MPAGMDWGYSACLRVARDSLHLNLVVRLVYSAHRNVPGVFARASIRKLCLRPMIRCEQSREELGNHAGLLIPNGKERSVASLKPFHLGVRQCVNPNRREVVAHTLPAGLTFELRGRQRQAARPRLVKMYRVPPAGACRIAVGAPLE